jgi:hypothetical protein
VAISARAPKNATIASSRAQARQARLVPIALAALRGEVLPGRLRGADSSKQALA